MHLVYLLLGSNQGNKQYFLIEACKQIESKAGKTVKASSLYETQPWGEYDQDLFVNQVIVIKTALEPATLLHCLLEIELDMGRVRVKKWMERIIDIDILYYENLEINLPNLIIPHPQIANRRFTLVPLVEIDPDYVHPTLKQTNQELLTICKDELEVKKL